MKLREELNQLTDSYTNRDEALMLFEDIKYNCIKYANNGYTAYKKVIENKISDEVFMKVINMLVSEDLTVEVGKPTVWYDQVLMISWR